MRDTFSHLISFVQSNFRVFSDCEGTCVFVRFIIYECTRVCTPPLANYIFIVAEDICIYTNFSINT